MNKLATGQPCPQPSPALLVANARLMELRQQFQQQQRRAAQGRPLVVNSSQAGNGRLQGVQP